MGCRVDGSRGCFPKFTPTEIMEIERLFKELRGKSRSQRKQKKTAAKVPKSPVAPEDPPIDLTPTNNAPEIHQKPKVESVASLSGLIFEAKSSKDNAWYDVASFLNYRVLYRGQLEVRVRFAGFGYDNDEWVNVERGVRERSIPLEHSECGQVKVGDLVLSFRETNDEAIYCDAHIVKIQRKLHDIRGCRCIFWVRYDHDKAEEKARLTGLCCRPK